jgi:hypothetical protein
MKQGVAVSAESFDYKGGDFGIFVRHIYVAGTLG